MSSPVACEVYPDGVAQITLTREEAANSRNQAMRDALLDWYARLAADVRIKCVILTGAGSRHFCAGMDMKEAREREPILMRRERLASARDIDALAQLPVPTIAAINGTALGGGFEMALACDLRYMAVEAQVSLPELSHGLVPAGGASLRLPAVVGPTRASELIYLGARLSGPQAESIGLVNKAVPRSELAQVVREVASTIARSDRAALLSAKRLLSRGQVTARDSDMELDALLLLMAHRDEVVEP